MGAGDGSGEGQGKGQGEGRGEDTTTNVAIGGAVAIAFTVIMCCVGIPMLIAGVIFVTIHSFAGNSYFFNMGVAFIVVASLLTIGGIVLIILICTGVCGTKKNPQTTTQTVVVTSPGQPMQMSPPQAGYQPAPQGYQPPPQGYQPPPQGYPPAQPGYPPAQQGYPPAQQGYPPAQQGYPPVQGYNEGQPPPYAPEKM